MKRKNRLSQKKLEQKIYRRRARTRSYLKVKNRLANRQKLKIKANRITYDFVRHDPPATLNLPSNFSFINNPESILQAFAKFRNYANDGRDVILNFQHVTKITPDVIPLLLAKVSNYQRLINISGTRPLNKDVDTILRESGFYKKVGLTRYKSTRGLLDTHKSKIVDTDIAVEARKLTAEKTFGDSNKRIQPLYRTLIECMANTRKHASDDNQRESWWLSVYNDPETRITSFAFCDTGIGIFKSSKLEKITKIAVKIGLKNNRSILQEILEGKIASSTGLPYRGKGLPKIYSDYNSHALKRLCIAANDTFADFDSGIFIDLPDELNGTFLYWEIHPN